MKNIIVDKSFMNLHIRKTIQGGFLPGQLFICSWYTTRSSIYKYLTIRKIYDMEKIYLNCYQRLLSTSALRIFHVTIFISLSRQGIFGILRQCAARLRLRLDMNHLWRSHWLLLSHESYLGFLLPVLICFSYSLIPLIFQKSFRRNISINLYKQSSLKIASFKLDLDVKSYSLILTFDLTLIMLNLSLQNRFVKLYLQPFDLSRHVLQRNVSAAHWILANPPGMSNYQNYSPSESKFQNYPLGRKRKQNQLITG